MNWKDATLRELLETPIFDPPFVWLKVGACVATFVLMILVVAGIDSFLRRT